jgi:tetratricopeptide (TPR) repeat protein
MALGSAGRANEGLAPARLAVERDPDALLSHWALGLVAHWSGEFEESIAAHQRALAVSGRSSFPLAQLALAYGDWGRPAEARATYDELVALSARIYVPCTMLAIAASGAADMDTAINFIQQACDQREPILLLGARVFPSLRRLREDPRFADVLRRLALPA